jgi:hypothetical protein
MESLGDGETSESEMERDGVETNWNLIDWNFDQDSLTTHALITEDNACQNAYNTCLQDIKDKWRISLETASHSDCELRQKRRSSHESDTIKTNRHESNMMILM